MIAPTDAPLSPRVGQGMIVVVGVGRSGTSLLQAMLHAHPDLTFLPETHFFRRYVGPVVRRLVMEARGADALVHLLKDDEEFQRTGIPPDELLAPFSTRRQPFRVADVYLHLVEEYRNRHSGKVVGDKDPRLIDFLPALDQFVPGVRVVHIIRDPRDVLLSRRKAAWSEDRSDWSHVLTYRAQMTRARNTGPARLGRRYLEVHYEDLLSRPEKTLAQVCDHVGVEFDEAMMSFGNAGSELVDDDEWQWKKETTGPLMRDNMGKWKGELDPSVQRIVEKICIEPFSNFQYRSTESAQAGEWPIRIANLLAAGASRAYPLRMFFG